MSSRAAEIIGWIAVVVCGLLFTISQLIYWYDACESKLRFDQHLEREGQPVPVRKGIRWWFFLWLHKRF